MRYVHNGLIGLGLIALMGLGSLGCRITPPSGYAKIVNYPAKIAKLKGLQDEMEGIPETRARFCLEQANRLYKKAERNTYVDYTLLSLGGATAGGGVISSAVAGAMDKDDAHKTRTEMAAAALIASSAAFLSVRTALGLYDVSRVERESAARNVDAALAILTAYALAEDPEDVDYTKLTTCSDGEVAVASAFAGAAAGQDIDRLSAKKDKEAAEGKKEAQESRTAGLVKLKQGEEDLKKAKAESATPAPPPKPPKGSGTADTAVDEQEKKVRAATLQVLEAKVEIARADVLAAKAEVDTKKAAILRVARQLRAAVFFLTATDVELANEGLTTAKEELKASKAAVDKASDRLAEAEKVLAEEQGKAAKEQGKGGS